MEENNLMKMMAAVLCGVGINLFYYYYYFEENYLLSSCFLGILVQILFWIASSWLENILYLLFMKMHNYKVQSICIYPLEIYFGAGVSINGSLLNLLDVSGSVKIEEMAEEEKEFFGCYQKMVRLFFWGNVVLIFASLGLLWKSVLLGVVSCLLDSLLDHKNYLTENMQNEVFHILCELGTPIYQRMAFLFMAHDRAFGTGIGQVEKDLYQQYVDESLLGKNEKYRKKITKYQKNDFRIWSDVRNGNRRYRERVRLLAEMEGRV